MGQLANKKHYHNVGRAGASLRADDKPLTYLESGAVYQIYPRSFQDSDGDGVGDLKGALINFLLFSVLKLYI